MNNNDRNREEASRTLPGNGHQGGPTELAEKAKQTASQLASEVKDGAKERASAVLSQQKDRAASSIEGVAGALHDTGRSLHDQGMALPVDQYVDRAADQIARMGDYLRRRTLGELVSDAEQFARREPAVFLGGAFALGLLAGRLLKSSRQDGGAPQPMSREAPRALEGAAQGSGGPAAGSRVS